MSSSKAYYALIPGFVLGCINLLFGGADIDGLDIAAITGTVIGIMVYLYLTPRRGE